MQRERLVGLTGTSHLAVGRGWTQSMGARWGQNDSASRRAVDNSQWISHVAYTEGRYQNVVAEEPVDGARSELFVFGKHKSRRKFGGQANAGVTGSL